MNLKSFLYSVVVLMLFFNLSIKAQSVYHCGQSILHERCIQNTFNGQHLYFEQVKKIKSMVQNQVHSAERQEIVYTIPVVFHVLHQDGPENISYEQIEDQIRILNIDYQKKNADTIDVTPPFKDLIANIGFEFKLATIDPYGNCTNGVVRHQTPLTHWDANNLNNFLFSWPTDKYLNIYVVHKINIPATAYAFLPGTPVPPTADVIVTNHDMVGSIGTGTVGNSWVLTHEAGHWFGLPHIWGVSNAPGVECGDDFIEDTPITKGFTHCNLNATKVCNPAIHENIQNYMDYSPCKIMFTVGQKEYMYATIHSGINGRDHVVSEDNLIATGVIGDKPCKTISDFYTKNYTVCMRDTIEFVSYSHGGEINTKYKWTFQNANIETSSDSLVKIIFNSPGEHTIVLETISANGRHEVIKKIQVNDGYNGVVPTQIYSFEEAELNNELIVHNIDQDEVKWKIYQGTGANNSQQCIYLNNITDNNTQGFVDYFETPFFNFTNVEKPQLSFYYAYAKKHTQQNDSFKIQYTLDCGATWLNLPSIPTMNAMANATGGISTNPFTPNENQWKKLTLTSIFRSFFKNKPSVKFRVFFKSDLTSEGSNNLFLDEFSILDEDDINTSIDEEEKSNVEIYPNPTSGSFSLHLENVHHQQLNLTLYNADGKKIDANKTKLLYTKENQLDYHTDLPTGIYIVHINTEKKVIIKKLVVG